MHVYQNAGDYTVNLTVANDFGTDTFSREILVMGRVGSIARTNVSCVQVESIGDTQLLKLNTTFCSYIYNATENVSMLTVYPSSEYGLEEITVLSQDGVGFTDLGSGLIQGNVTAVTLQSGAIQLDLLQDPVNKNATVSYELALSRYPPVGTITAYAADSVTPADYRDLLNALILTEFVGITGIAYQIQFEKANLGETGPAILVWSVNATWVNKMGGRDRIYLMRMVRSSTEVEAEVLPTEFLYHDASQNLDYFRAVSPRGLDGFVLTALHGAGNIFQLIVAHVSDGGSYESPTPVVTTPSPAVTVPLSSMIVFNTTGTLNPSADGVVNESIQIEAGDSVGALYVAGGTQVLDATGEPLREVRIEPVPAETVPPLGNISNLWFEGYAYALQPEGATFDPPIVFSLTIPEAEWNISLDYRIGWYNGSASHWELLPTAVNDTRRIASAEVSHFSTFALCSIVEPGNATEENVVLQREPMHPTPTMPTSAFTILSGMLTWVITSVTSRGPLVLGGIAAIAVGLFIWWRRH